MTAEEAELLTSLVGSLRDLLIERAESAPRDELAALTGIVTGHAQPPTDVTLGRLLPDFHRPDQDETLVSEAVSGQLAAGLRSVNEPLIIDAKLAAARTMRDTLPDGGGPIALDAAQADDWLTALNDIRLALGAMLGIDADTPDELPPDHPQAAHLDVYHWLTAVQELLVITLSGRR